MRVILNRDVPNLGEEGDIREVAPGYARNYLMPKGLVIAYNDQNLADIEGRREAIEQRKAEKRTQAMGLKERLEADELRIEVTAGQNGRLFGSVTTATIVEALAKHGIDIERKRVDIPDGTIKSVGVHPVRVRLYEDQEASIKVRVAPHGQEAQKETSPAAEADGPVETTEATEDSATADNGQTVAPDAAGDAVAEGPAADDSPSKDSAEDEDV